MHSRFTSRTISSSRCSTTRAPSGRSTVTRTHGWPGSSSMLKCTEPKPTSSPSLKISGMTSAPPMRCDHATILA